ncbi:MAG: helix-turn-helix transcriptional regulator [Clostridia bacterium]|nr:helix-turn-helix transcriptional regulator [Clostridia bacterium]
MDLIDLGNRIRLCRQSAKMTQEQLAEKIGVCTSFIGHIERGTRVTSLETLVTLCNVLNVSMDYLLAKSLNNNYEKDMPLGLSEREKDRLSEFLRLAQNTVRSWDD